MIPRPPKAEPLLYEPGVAGRVQNPATVAVGSLAEISPDELTVDRIEQYGEAKRPRFEFWAASKRDLDTRLYPLDPAEVSGRRTEIDESMGE